MVRVVWTVLVATAMVMVIVDGGSVGADCANGNGAGGINIGR